MAPFPPSPAMNFTQNISACPTQSDPHVLTYHQALEEFARAPLHQTLERGSCCDCSIAALPSPAGTTGHSHMSPPPHAYARYYSCSSWVHCRQAFVSKEVAHRYASPKPITEVVKKGFYCPHESCDKVYTSKQNAAIHIEKKHSVGLRENFERGLCDTTLGSKSAAKRQKEVHTKRHTCAWCGQSYKRAAYALGQHKQHCRGLRELNKIGAASV